MVLDLARSNLELSNAWASFKESPT
jgi:hypothetical protein